MTFTNDPSPAATVFKSVVAAVSVLLAAYLVWGLRSLIVPVAVSGLLAYICRPLVTWLERYRVPRGVAIGLLLLLFVVTALFIVSRLRAIVPTETAAVEYKVQVLYKINQRYKALMGLDQSLTRGNQTYRWISRDLDPLVDRLNQVLALTPEERAQFLTSRPVRPDAPAGSDRLLDSYRANLETAKARARAGLAEPGAGGPSRPAAAEPLGPAPKTLLAALGDILSTWLIAPLVFLFLLSDTGEIKRGLLRAVPNRLFEPVLTVLEDLDRALGGYVRGVFLECLLLGLTVAVLLPLVGVPLRWAIVIGLLTGASNLIPYLGFAAALLGGLTYAFLTEDSHPLLPMIDGESVWIWVIVAVALAELLKNSIYEPLVLGRAVNLHPLVVVIGVFGGGMLFGVVGMLLAIPTITVFKAFVSSTATQLKAYGLI